MISLPRSTDGDDRRRGILSHVETVSHNAISPELHRGYIDYTVASRGTGSATAELNHTTGDCARTLWSVERPWGRHTFLSVIRISIDASESIEHQGAIRSPAWRDYRARTGGPAATEFCCEARGRLKGAYWSAFSILIRYNGTPSGNHGKAR